MITSKCHVLKRSSEIVLEKAFKLSVGLKKMPRNFIVVLEHRIYCNAKNVQSSTMSNDRIMIRSNFVGTSTTTHAFYTQINKKKSMS
jgi:hypothetical protein